MEFKILAMMKLSAQILLKALEKTLQNILKEKTALKTCRIF